MLLAKISMATIFALALQVSTDVLNVIDDNNNNNKGVRNLSKNC